MQTDLKITGKIAQFGSSVIKGISEKLLGQFVESLEDKLAADPAPSAGTTPSGAAPPPAATESATGASTPTVGSNTQQLNGTPASQVIVPEREAQPLNLMSVAGGTIYKRLIPVVVVIVIIVALIIYFLVR